MLQELTSAIFAANELNVQLGGSALDEKSVSQLKAWGAGIFRLVVVGEIKKGKSSFINALLGIEELVPTCSDVATSTVFKIHYAKERFYQVFFRVDTGKDPLPINESDLPFYGTENGNPGNEKGVAFIEVGVPSSFLKSGIVIFDTPGLGGLFKEHRRITYECLPKADAVFFVTDSTDAPLGRLETNYLSDIKDITPHIFFVQTKCCRVDTAARDSRKSNNLRTLSTCLSKAESSIPYFLVDSKLRFEADKYKDLDDLQDSGYPSVLSFVQNKLQAQQHKLLADFICTRSQPLLAEIQHKITTRKEILAADSSKAREELTDKAETKQKELKEWQTKQQPQLMRELRNRLNSIHNEAIDRCDDNKPMGKFHVNINERINTAKDVETLQRILHEINQELPAQASSCMSEVSFRLQQDVEKLLKELGSSLLKIQRSSRCGLGINVPTSALAHTATNIVDNNLFNSLRTGAYGAMAGAAMVGVVGGIIGSIVPVVGTVIGSCVGMLIAAVWGGTEAYLYQEEQQLKAAKAQALNAVNQTVAALYGELSKSLKRIIEDIDLMVQDAIDEFIRDRNESLTNEMAEIKERGNMQATEIAAKQKEICAAESKLAGINRSISEALSSTSADTPKS